MEQQWKENIIPNSISASIGKHVGSIVIHMAAVFGSVHTLRLHTNAHSNVIFISFHFQAEM